MSQSHKDASGGRMLLIHVVLLPDLTDRCRIPPRRRQRRITDVKSGARSETWLSLTVGYSRRHIYAEFDVVHPWVGLGRKITTFICWIGLSFD